MDKYKYWLIANLILFLVLVTGALYLISEPEQYSTDNIPGIDSPMVVGVEKTYLINNGLDFAKIAAPIVDTPETSILVKISGKSYVNCDTDLMNGTWVLSDVASGCGDAEIISVKGKQDQKYYMTIGKAITDTYFTSKNGWSDGAGYIFTEDSFVIEKYYAN